MTTAKVTQLARTFTKNGERYGPFKATADKPFLEVPLSVAMASGAPLYDEDAAQAQVSEEGSAGAHIDDLIQANADLKADLEKNEAFIGEALDVMGWQAGSGISPAQLIRNIKGSAETNRKLLDEAQTLIAGLERENSTLAAQVTSLQARLAEQGNGAGADVQAQGDSTSETTGEPSTEGSTEPDVQTNGTPLPEDLVHRALLIEHGFDTMEKLATGLLTTEEQAESPVQQINGIGAKTVKAYGQIVTDWRASQ